MKIRQVEFTEQDIVEGMLLLMEERGYCIDFNPNNGKIVELDETDQDEFLTIDFNPER